MALPSLAPPPEVQRPRVLVMGTVFATAAAAMVFTGLIGMWVLQRTAAFNAGQPTLPDGVTIPLTQPNVMLFGLLMSSVTIQWAVAAVKNDDRVGAYMALGLTILFGVAYINMTAFLWSIMGFEIENHTTAPLLYTITGAHVGMAVIAMAFVGLMAFRALAGEYTSRHDDGIVAVAIFWHAMVLVYCVFWHAIYVMK